MKQFHELLDNIKSKGVWKEPARENMPRTLSLFGTRMEFDMKDGFPLLTTKKMYTKAIFVELLWFLKGDTNIKYLVDNGCNIWNKDSYVYYLKQWNKSLRSKGIGLDYEMPWSLDNFIKQIKSGELYQTKTSHKTNYKLGDLGKVYGYTWRKTENADQIQHIVDSLIKNPMSRYHILDAWDLRNFDESALMPCHLLYQFNCRPLTQQDKVSWVLNNVDVQLENLYVYEETQKETTPKYYLDLQMYQRSCDTFLGVPFNIASASLLLHLVAKTVNMIPSKFVWVGGDTHIYENHLEQVDELLSRDYNKYSLPNIEILKDLNSIKDLENLTIEDINVVDYESYPKIKAELKTGL